LCCSGIVPVAFLIICLILLRFILNQKTIKGKETLMEQVNRTEKLKLVMKSIFETIWAIGTSAAAAGVLPL
jgi:hypothetical protein